jgi:inorganic pyrophosphatase/exopolyphosphatase
MSKTLVVVGGSSYADIDVLACVFAYKELLTLLGKKALAVITGPWNQTIPASMRSWKIDIDTELKIDPKSCEFVLVDFSDPKHMEKFVTLEAVREVFDHHFGHEEFWKERLGKQAYIEKVGACATLIWEQFKFYGVQHLIKPLSANLLYTAIFANTLDFKSSVTHQRDTTSATELLPYTTTAKDWKSIYYAEVAQGFEEDVQAKICQDTKTIELFGKIFSFGQIELWDARSLILSEKIANLPPRKHQGAFISDWIVNIVSIEEGKSYLYSNSQFLKNVLAEITSATTHDETFLVTEKLWLRKELLRDMLLK